MKLLDSNWLSPGLTGKMDGMVFYQVRGKTFIRKAPQTGYNKIPTEKQAANRELFIAAQLFAQSVVRDPALKAAYAKKGGGRHSAYIQALSDFMRAKGQII
jgi:hypothetical protein